MTTLFLLLALLGVSGGAVVAPPWADPALNPCAAKPRGWQMLFWPADGMCYTIFKLGHPCPASMELTPGRSGGAECRCPPRTLRLWNATECHPIFSRGPCQAGEYFTPNSSTPKSEYRVGRCVRPPPCPDPTQAAWPADGRCYRALTRGPCAPGLLLTKGEDGVANCTCSDSGPVSHHRWEGDGRCYERYSRGPCSPGELLLPGGKCGCETHLPQYHGESGACYQIGTVGPCNKGQRFNLSPNTPGRAQCICKPGNALWTDGSCYRLYTRGPCAQNELLAPPARCVPLPCRRSRLYFPEHKRCFKIGTQGPCKPDQVVLFDFEARPSVDGIAYNGVCGCAGALSLENPEGCVKNKMADESCKDSPGMVAIDGGCHMLYTKGPCGDGQWLVPQKNSTDSDKTAECACKPGFTKYPADDSIKEGGLKDSCLPPTVSLARYLNVKFKSN